MNTPERVEEMLRAAMIEKRAMGWKIEAAVIHCRQVSPGITCACALGCVGAGYSDARDALGIDRQSSLLIAVAFDGGPAPVNLDLLPWFDIGARLRAEFLPNEVA